MPRLERVFCATSWELEGERRAFYDTVGGVNEHHGIPAGVLFVAVTLTSVRDKRPLQYVIEENIQDSTYYILALDGDWGPTERNFERDYYLALEYRADPARPMRHVELLLRSKPDGTPPEFSAELFARGIAHRVFRDTAGFQDLVRGLLLDWLPRQTDAAHT
jgi:hypothetical protein